MKRLLAGGCSLMWGAELSDSPDHAGATPPSQKTWPALWAKSRGIKYTTCAQCGYSNQGVARAMINSIETFGSPDYVIMQWTFLGRYEIRFNNIVDGNFFTLNHWLGEEIDYDIPELIAYKKQFDGSPMMDLAKIWYRHVDNIETRIYTYLKEQVSLATYLKYKNIPFVFTETENDYLSLDEQITDVSVKTLLKLRREMPVLAFNRQGFYEWAVANNLAIPPKSHPNDQAHVLAFNMLQDQLDKILLK